MEKILHSSFDISRVKYRNFCININESVDFNFVCMPLYNLGTKNNAREIIKYFILKILGLILILITTF